jgi:hypothetical protein
MGNRTLMGRSETTASPFTKLAQAIQGRIATTGDERYDASRTIWNAALDRRPAAIVYPENVKDIIEVVRFAREQGMSVSAKSGGHGISGGAVRDDGITIDFNRWTGVEVDPGARVARVQPGITWGDFDSATQEFGLATPGGKLATVGVGGSSLGGGIGWLIRKHGLAIDNLRAITVVTGEGELVHASETEHPDLFWGLRGAGSMLGIATSFEYDLHPVGPVVAGLVGHPLPRAADMLAFYREFIETAPEELTSVAVLLHGPDGQKMAGIAVTYAGDVTEGERVLQPLREFGPPVVDMIATMPYGLLQRELAKTAVSGVHRTWKSAYVNAFSDELIEAITAAFAASPGNDTAILLEHYGGAANRVSSTATAFPHRDVDKNLVIDAGWRAPEDEEPVRTWLGNLWETARPHTRQAVYASYLDVDDGQRGHEAFGAVNYQRIRDLKLQFDPAGLFAKLPGVDLGR